MLVTSSTTAYGAFPDNPVPITEDWPVRGVAAFEYARDKTESDRLCQLWALRHPERTMTIVRPCIVFGPNVDNYLVRIWTNAPFQPDFGGNLDQLIQFVHEDDLVDAIVGLLDGRHGGAFNVTGDGVMTMRETAEVLGTKVRKMPLRLAKAISRVTWRLGASETPPGQIEFAMNPWVCSNEKVKETLGWQPRYTSRETFEVTMRAHGVLGNGRSRAGSCPKSAPRRPDVAAATLAPTRAVSSVGRAPARQAGGRWFEPSTAHLGDSLAASRHRGRGRCAGADRRHRARAPAALPRHLRRARRGHHEPPRVLLAVVRGGAPLADVGGGERLRAAGRQPAVDGRPHRNEPNRDCSNGTGSAVFRMWTKRSDFGDVAVSFGLRNDGFTPTGESWDGVKIYLRRQDGDNFYTAEVNRREGNVIVQRKCDGRYALLGGVARRGDAGARRRVGGRGRHRRQPVGRRGAHPGRARRRASCSRRPIRPGSCDVLRGRDGSESAATGPSSTWTASRCAA